MSARPSDSVAVIVNEMLTPLWPSDGVRVFGNEEAIKHWADRLAALAPVTPQYVECRQCDECEHVGISDAHPTDAACHNCEWSGPSPVEDKCPGCGSHSCMAAACPKCSARYRLSASATIPAPVTPASGVDWRAMYRFQTAMRFMDNVPKLTRDRAYQMADDEMRGLEAQTPSRDQGDGK